jgi:hypothetical protein
MARVTIRFGVLGLMLAVLLMVAGGGQIAAAQGDPCVSIKGNEKVNKGSFCFSDDTSKAIAVNNSSAVALGNSKAIAVNNSSAVALINSEATAINNSDALAFINSEATAINNSDALALFGSEATAINGCTAVAISGGEVTEKNCP